MPRFESSKVDGAIINAKALTSCLKLEMNVINV
jgi:hypothetical protein